MCYAPGPCLSRVVLAGVYNISVFLSMWPAGEQAASDSLRESRKEMEKKCNRAALGAKGQRGQKGRNKREDVVWPPAHPSSLAPGDKP